MASELTEKQEIKKFKGKAQKNSGRGMYQKADAKLEPFLVDVKEAKEHFGLSKKVWAKICTDCARSGGEPSLMIALGEGRETVRLWVIGDSMFKEMRSAWLEKYGEDS